MPSATIPSGTADTQEKRNLSERQHLQASEISRDGPYRTLDLPQGLANLENSERVLIEPRSVPTTSAMPVCGRGKLYILTDFVEALQR